MKPILLLFISLFISMMVQAQVSKNIEVSAGGLKASLTSDELNSITNLTLTGIIDARDFKTMRDDMPVLAEIDLSGVTIAAYSGKDGTYLYETVYLVNQIPVEAFERKTKLTSISIPVSGTSIGDRAFEGCTGLTSVKIQNSITSIGNLAFFNCSGLTSFLIPNSVTSIGFGAFEGCTGLTSVSIPSSLTSIVSNPFRGCSRLKEFIVDGDNTQYASVDGVLFSNDKKILISYPNAKGSSYSIPNSVTSIESGAFFGCAALISVSIPNSVTSMIGPTFYGCSGLTSLIIPNSVTQMDGASFMGCTGLISITLPNSITSISQYAFEGCTSLTSVTIPNSVTSIGDFAFQGCTGLTSVTLSNNIKSIGDYTFSRCTSLISISIPTSVISIDQYAFWGCKGLTSVSIPDGVTSIGESAFQDCSGLDTVAIPGSIISIGNFAFSGCTGLVYLTLSNGVTSIGIDAFKDCSGLSSVLIPNSVTEIGGAAFNGCTGLTSVSIPSSVTEINSDTFRGCTGLTTITIPASVKGIWRDAFYDCNALTSIYCLGNTPPNSIWDDSWSSWCRDFFCNLDKTTCIIYVPLGSKENYTSSDWNVFKNIVEMPWYIYSSSSFFLEAKEGSATTADISSNVTWKVNTDQTWLTVSPNSGTGDTTLIFTAEANTSGISREATVTISAPYLEPITITVIQWASTTDVNDLDENSRDFTYYPNPFNSVTTINWQIANPGRVTLKVLDIIGRTVATLVDEQRPEGKYETQFNAGKLSNGIYFCQLKAGEFSQTRKIILLK